jgi:hypothetical protein
MASSDPSDDDRRAEQARTRAEQPGALNIVRLALLAGVLVFGGICFLMDAVLGALPMMEPRPPIMQTIFTALGALPLGGALAVRQLRGRAETPKEARNMTVIGWAVAEVAPLSGGLYYLLAGTPTLYLVGLGVFVLALVVLSPPETQA